MREKKTDRKRERKKLGELFFRAVGESALTAGFVRLFWRTLCRGRREAPIVSSLSVLLCSSHGEEAQRQEWTFFFHRRPSCRPCPADSAEGETKENTNDKDVNSCVFLKAKAHAGYTSFHMYVPLPPYMQYHVRIDTHTLPCNCVVCGGFGASIQAGIDGCLDAYAFPCVRTYVSMSADLPLYISSLCLTVTSFLLSLSLPEEPL